VSQLYGGENKLKEMFAMGCITALGIVQLALYGDGSVLMACVTAIAALAGVSVGSELSKKKE
jgi:hypothetical protein